MNDDHRQHPWLRLERALRTILVVRLERGSRDDVDRALMTVIGARERVERAGFYSSLIRRRS